jgi:nicotinic acid mononucleotide adenylyltransferase
MDANDLHVLFGHRDLLRQPAPEPALHFVGRVPQAPSRVAIVSGSFNPPTSAHQLIAERAKADGCDAAIFALPAQVAGKEAGGLIPEDRLLALRMIAPRSGIGIAVCSHGLYVEQAEAAARAFPGASLHFLVGSDKVMEIFDAAWYEDRDAALDRLFSLASFTVAPRAADGPRVRAVLEAPENRRYADAIRVVALHPSVADLSSTRVRGLLEAGADASGFVAPAVANLLGELRPFARPQRISGEVVDPYQVRARLIDALWEVREWAERAADLRGLVALATAATPDGARIRRLLALGGPGAEELFRLQALTGA